MATHSCWFFRENFSDTDWVKLTEVYWELTTPQILTMEYAPGIKINRAVELDRLGIDKARIARLSVECYLQQIRKKGLFHAAPQALLHQRASRPFPCSPRFNHFAHSADPFHVICLLGG